MSENGPVPNQASVPSSQINDTGVVIAASSEFTLGIDTNTFVGISDTNVIGLGITTTFVGTFSYNIGPSVSLSMMDETHWSTNFIQQATDSCQLGGNLTYINGIGQLCLTVGPNSSPSSSSNVEFYTKMGGWESLNILSKALLVTDDFFKTIVYNAPPAVAGNSQINIFPESITIFAPEFSSTNLTSFGFTSDVTSITGTPASLIFKSPSLESTVTTAFSFTSDGTLIEGNPESLTLSSLNISLVADSDLKIEVEDTAVNVSLNGLQMLGPLIQLSP